MIKYSGWLIVMWALVISFGFPKTTAAEGLEGGIAAIQAGTLSVDVNNGVDQIHGTVGSIVFRGVFKVLLLDLGYEKVKLLGTSRVSGVTKEISYESQGPYVGIGLRLPTTVSIGIKKQFNFANKWEETVTASGVETESAGYFKHSSTSAFMQFGAGLEIGIRRSDYTQAGSLVAEGAGIYLMWNVPLEDIKVRN